jgi:hypothetical protein
MSHDCEKYTTKMGHPIIANILEVGHTMTYNTIDGTFHTMKYTIESQDVHIHYHHLFGDYLSISLSLLL